MALFPMKRGIQGVAHVKALHGVHPLPREGLPWPTGSACGAGTALGMDTSLTAS